MILLILFKLIITIFILSSLFLLRGGIKNPFYTCFKIGNTQFDRFVSKIRLHVPWSLFIGMDDKYHDIIITATTDQDTKYEWSVLNDKNIGGVKIQSYQSRLTLTFYYDKMFQTFLSDFFAKEISDYIYKNNHEKVRTIVFNKIFFSSNSAPDGKSTVIQSQHIHTWRA